MQISQYAKADLVFAFVCCVVFFFFLNHVLGNGFLKVAAIKDVLNVVSGIHQCFAFQEINLVLACII